MNRLRLLVSAVLLSGCAHPSSTKQFIKGEMEHERGQLIGAAEEEARARCGGPVEVKPDLVPLGGGQEAGDYRCVPPRK